MNGASHFAGSLLVEQSLTSGTTGNRERSAQLAKVVYTRYQKLSAGSHMCLFKLIE